MFKEMSRVGEIPMSPEFTYKERLSNGLRVLVHEMPWARTVSVTLFIKSGPRYETPETAGISHLTEHMIYEGNTWNPTRRTIDRATLRLHGENIAHTDDEFTLFEINQLSQKCPSTTPFLRQLVFNPRLSAEDIEKEKNICLRELSQERDNHDYRVWRLLREFVWGNHPLAGNPLGTVESLGSMGIEDVRRFYSHFYRPDNAILVFSGNIREAEAIEYAKTDFGDLNKRSRSLKRVPPPRFKPKARVLIEERDSELSRILLGFSTGLYGKANRQQSQIQLLTEILKKSLFYGLVYKKGIAYSAGAHAWLESDTGIISAYAYVDPVKTPAVKLMIQEVTGFRIDQDSVDEAKDQLKVSLALDLDSPEQLGYFIGKQEFYKGQVQTPEEVLMAIDKITPRQLEDLRRMIFREDNAALVILGPVKTESAEKFGVQLQF